MDTNSERLDAYKVVELCQSGSVKKEVWDQFSEILSSYINYLPTINYLSIKDREDIVQDVILKILEKRIKPFNPYRNNRGLKNYLLGYLRNSSRNYLKTNNRSCALEAELLINNYQDHVDWKIEYEQLRSSMPKEERKVIDLKYIEGHTFNEIANILNISRHKAGRISRKFEEHAQSINTSSVTF